MLNANNFLQIYQTDWEPEVPSEGQESKRDSQ